MFLQLTSNDIILSGHGCTMPTKGQVTRVPYGIDFYLLAPPGCSISDKFGHALETGAAINGQKIVSPGQRSEAEYEPVIYTASSGDVPNLLLCAPRDEDAAGNVSNVLDISGKIVPHLIGVERDTHLGDLWSRIKPLLKPGTRMRVFWGACASTRGYRPGAQPGVNEPMVTHY